MNKEACKANREKLPELLESVEELQKAAEVVRRSALEVCEWLRIDGGFEKEPSPPEPSVSLIIERAKFLVGLGQHLYETNSYLERIMRAVREI